MHNKIEEIVRNFVKRELTFFPGFFEYLFFVTMKSELKTIMGLKLDGKHMYFK